MDVTIHWTYKTKKNKQFSFTSELVSVGEALHFAEDIESTKRAVEIEFMDERHVSWTKKELQKLIEELKEEPSEVEVYFDGGYDKETRVAGVGICIYYVQNGETYRIRKNAKLLGLDNNNEAEYAALELGLKELQVLGVTYQTIRIKGDSQVVLQQLAGEWVCYEDSLNRYMDRIEGILKEQKLGWKSGFISRKENKECHQLATQAIQDIAIFSNSKLTRE